MAPEIDRLREAFEDHVRTLQRAIEQRDRELAVLSQVASRVHAVEGVQEILDIALEEVLHQLGLTTAWIFTGDDRERRLSLAASRGVNPAYLEQVRREGLSDCLCPEVFWTGHRMQARNTTQCPRMPDIIEGLQAPVAHACIPLKFEGTTKGVLNVAARPGEQFSEEELRFLETLGHQIGLAVERARHREAEQLRNQEARALAEINRGLYEEARRAFRELKAAQERIIQNEKMAVLGTFASGLAHEVRNPLNSIALQLSILERRISRVEAGMAAEMVDLTKVIREEIRRLDTLVNDFLLFSRADRVQHHPADLDLLVDEVVRLLGPEAGAAGVTVCRERVGEPLRQFPMDAEKIKQVVINLVRNAIEAMPQGGTVVVESGLSEGQARLAVKDDGPGLPEGVDVFQLFVTTKPGGTGLGLSIVQQIVLQHGGEIRAQSRPGHGTSFVIDLPVTPAVEPREGVRA